MTPREDPEPRPDGQDDAPSADEVAHDFSVPDDADLRPTTDDGGAA